MIPEYREPQQVPAPLTWQQVFDCLVMAGLSKRRATQLTDWICARGVVRKSERGSAPVVALLTSACASMGAVLVLLTDYLC
jgi:hypothetical protein